MCLDSALRAAAEHQYPAALVQLRTALEHQVFDRLLFLASRHVQVIEGVTDELWDRWQTNPPGLLLDWSRLSNDRVRAVWRGIRVVIPAKTVYEEHYRGMGLPLLRGGHRRPRPIYVTGDPASARLLLVEKSTTYFLNPHVLNLLQNDLVTGDSLIVDGVSTSPTEEAVAAKP